MFSWYYFEKRFHYGGSYGSYKYGNSMSVEERVKKIVVDELGVEESRVNKEVNIVDDLGADSLDMVGLVIALEQEFDLEIPEEEIEKICTVGQAVGYIETHKTKEEA